VRRERDRQRHEPGAPVDRAGAWRWVAALSVVVSTLVLVPAAASAPSTKFVSQEYGYSIVLPGSSGDWGSHFALVPWSSGSLEPNTPAFDTFTNLRVFRMYVVAARRPPTGSTLGKWTAFVKSTRTAAGCSVQPSVANSTLAGAAARVFTYACSGDYYGIVITTLHDHRGYFMLVAGRASAPHASDRRAFNAARASFGFIRK
jgi:hypothetical protein